MGRKPKLSAETKVYICNQYLDRKKSSIELSKEYHVSNTTVRDWASKYQAQGAVLSILSYITRHIQKSSNNRWLKLI